MKQNPIMFDSTAVAISLRKRMPVKLTLKISRDF